MVRCTTTLPANATGQVGFIEGATSLGTGTIVDERATFSTTTLSVGAHSITAVYAGDINYNGASSSAASLVVNKATLNVLANDQQRSYGQPNPPLTATTSGFVNGDTSAVVTGVPVVSTSATPSSPVGPYAITVASGTLAAANYNFTTINGTLVVTPVAATITLTSSENPGTAGGSGTLTATVTPGSTGTVTFLDGSTVLGVVTLVNSVAILPVAGLSVGSHNITASCSGDANFGPAISTVFVQVIVPDFTLANQTPPQLVPPGGSASYDLEATSKVPGVFDNPLSLSASGGPAGATFSFSPIVINAARDGATSTMTVHVPGQTASVVFTSKTPLLLAALLLPFAAMRRVRGKPHRLIALLVLLALGSAIGCGAGGYFNQSQATYIITVTGTSGNLSRSTTVTLTVQ
jgi:hypothetical protein